ncbi:MAG: thioredoxin fold domain-containing protein [Desulfamplus sp.]|nr:thioredoxin fold domain-containing protein [Desulfamplus sp.]MBF0241775.1 thioredoxin fold domain-containing protein [Desulfamplus sp.]MBF0390669.1 thioredoxin fold domain-containing protein [Desulfamplus sp.]
MKNHKKIDSIFTLNGIIFTVAMLLVIAISLMSLMPPPVDGASGGISWQTHDKGIPMAKEQKKKIFVYFHAEWCGYCRKMEGGTFKDKAVIDYLNANFIAIKVDSDVETKVAESYAVRGLPTCWFLKANGDKLSNMPGYIDEKRLLTILKYVNTESYEKMSYSDFEKSL